MNSEMLKFAIDLLAVLLLALGIKGLSKVRSARSANRLAAIAMGLAVVGVLVDFLLGSDSSSSISADSWIWIVFGTSVGSFFGWFTAKRVPMTSMPETVALFNGCGGMSSLLVALGVVIFQSQNIGLAQTISVVVSVFVEQITFSGPIIAMAKLKGWFSTLAGCKAKCVMPSISLLRL